METIGDRLKELRQDLNLTQQYVADICKINRSTYSQYENNYNFPPQSVQISLSKFYNVSLDYLNCATDYKNYKINPPDLPTQFVDFYTYIPLLDVNTMDIIKNMIIEKDKVSAGDYAYFICPMSLISDRILKYDLILVKLKDNFKNGDIVIVKHFDKVILGRAMFSRGTLVLHNASLKNQFIALQINDYKMIGVVKGAMINFDT